MTFVIFILVVANLVSNYYWMKEVQKLVDKLMSRNYHEYSVAQSIPSTKPIAVQLEDPEDMDDIQLLNSIGR